MTKKVVIIDDSSTQLNILKTFFTKNDWEVCAVQSAKIGYEVIFDFAPDLIITDAIMPLMGGFQLIKLIRENEKISKIPIIVYSILDESNAKFYINEELSEYFLKKDNNQDQLLKMAHKITEKFPLDKEYKDEILRTGLNNYIPQQETKKDIKEEIFEEEIAFTEEIPKNEFNIEAFLKNFKTINNFSKDDEKLFYELFFILYNSLNYDLAVLDVFSYENNEKKTYFDVKNIILSPILKNHILNELQTKESVMYKKYAPNLKTITEENEFLSKLEFNLKYKNENIAHFIFYSQKENAWQEIENTESIEQTLLDFSKTRYIQRISQINKKDDFENRYNQLLNEFSAIKNTKEAYFAIIQILNFSDLKQNLSSQDLDIFVSKISQEIIKCLEREEQIHKNEEDEYSFIIFAKDEKQLKHRLEFIINTIEEITFEEQKINAFAAVSSCNIKDNFNIMEAQKNTQKIIEEINHQEKVVIYNE